MKGREEENRLRKIVREEGRARVGKRDKNGRRAKRVDEGRVGKREIRGGKRARE